MGKKPMNKKPNVLGKKPKVDKSKYIVVANTATGQQRAVYGEKGSDLQNATRLGEGLVARPAWIFKVEDKDGEPLEMPELAGAFK